MVSKTAATFADARDEAASALLPMIHRIDMPGLQQAAADYGVAMGAASASLGVSSAVLAYLATLPRPMANA